MALFRVNVKWKAGAPAFGVPARLFQGGYACGGWPGHMCDVGPDGRFLVQKKPEPAEQRARWDKLLSNRIVVDTGGVARLLADAEVGQ